MASKVFRLEASVLSLILLFVLMAVVLGVLLGVGTLWLQGYLYSQPVEKILMRAPAAALGLTLFFALWSYLEAKHPTRFEALLFSYQDTKHYPEFWTVKGNQKTHFKLRRNAQGRPSYLDDEAKAPVTHPDLIIVKDDDQEVQFKPDRDAKGNFQIEQGGSLQYRDERGRVMSESSIGMLSTTRLGALFSNLFINATHLVVWFLILWLVLRFQWSHALGLAFFFWLLNSLTLMPMLLSRAKEGTTPTPARTTRIRSITNGEYA